MKKMTRIEALTIAISILTNDETDIQNPDEVVEVLTTIRDSIAKANSRKNDKPTKAQVANMDIKSRLIAYMGDGNRYTIAELVKVFDNEFSSQKLSALIRQLILSGDVVREEDKHKAVFRLA